MALTGASITGGHLAAVTIVIVRVIACSQTHSAMLCKLPVGMTWTVAVCMTCRQALALSAACWPLHNRACLRQLVSAEKKDVMTRSSKEA